MKLYVVCLLSAFITLQRVLAVPHHHHGLEDFCAMAEASERSQSRSSTPGEAAKPRCLLRLDLEVKGKNIPPPLTLPLTPPPRATLTGVRKSRSMESVIGMPDYRF